MLDDCNLINLTIRKGNEFFDGDYCRWEAGAYSGGILRVKPSLFWEFFFNLLGFFEKKIPKHPTKSFWMRP